MLNVYGDISPRTAGYASAQLLKRGQYIMVTERWMDQRPLPMRSSRTMVARRYKSLDRATQPLVEGTPPAGKKVTFEDVTATLEQYGDYVELTDVIQDTHEDPVLQEYTDILGEQAAETYEVVRFGVLKGGTNVFYSNTDGTPTRAEVNTKLTNGVLSQVERSLLKQKAKHFTRVVRPSANYATEPIGACFVVLCHTDCIADVRALTGFTPVEKYAQDVAYPGEVGKVGNFRFIATPLCEPWLASGVAVGATGMLAANATNIDVYPYIVMAQNCAAVVPLKGKNAVEMKVVNPGKPAYGNPLGQAGSVGWIGYHGAMIQNDAWLARIECGATAAPTN